MPFRSKLRYSFRTLGHPWGAYTVNFGYKELGCEGFLLISYESGSILALCVW